MEPAVRFCRNPAPIPDIDVVFPVLHGTFGEDGTMQGLLELADLPYVGAGVMASAVSMDKEMMKRVCKERMLPIVEYVTVTRDCPSVRGRVPPPAVSRVRQARQSRVVRGDFEGARCRGTGGRLRPGRAVRPQGDCGAGDRGPRTGVLRAGQPGADGFPALRDSALARVLRLRRQIPARSGADAGTRRPARGAHRRSCATWPWNAIARWSARAWRAWISSWRTETNRLYINEINTIPGFTSISMYPKMWEHSGIGFGELLDRLIALALDRDKLKKATRFTR